MGTRVRVLLAIAALVVVLGAVPSAGALSVPAGFTDQLVATVGAPTALGFTPDGRMLVTTQPGRLYVVQNGSLLSPAALDLSAKTCSNSERGLLGVAADPLFSSSSRVYLYYTFRRADGICVNRVSYFLLPVSNQVNPATEVVLLDNIHSTAGNHNGGDLAFGKDGQLYVSVGDGGCDYAPGGGCAGSNDAARDRHVLIGKILRITRDGGIPAGNPWTGTGTARCATTGQTSVGTICQEGFAWGLRNPFRFAFDPNAAGTRFYINDVGQNTWEEIDVGQAGADYGWNVREGFCATGSTTNCGAPPAGMTNPIFAYGRSGGCASITGGAFAPNGAWRPEDDGKYFFSDYVCGTIWRLDPAPGGGFMQTPFATGLGSSSAVHLAFGPNGSSQALYYTTYAGGGQVRKIYYSAANGVPSAALTASPTSGPAPLTVSFNGSGSSDPDGDPLTYLWDFGDGQTATTAAPTVSHTYAAGTYTASLRVRDSRGATSAPATVTISVGTNTPPSASIVAPAAGATFTVGQTLTLTGSASDAQDGTLGAAAMSWEVRRHHNGSHWHPWFSGTGNNLTFQAPPPEDLQATGTGNHLEILLTVRDSGGLATTVTRLVQPRRVTLTFATSPSGLGVTVNGTAFTGPSSLVSWVGWALNVDAPSPQGSYVFWRWSDGGAKAHTIVTPASATTYTARFKRRVGWGNRGLLLG